MQGKPVLKFADLKNSYPGTKTDRAQIPSGWLVVVMYTSPMLNTSVSVTFVPDPDHLWGGNSLP